MNMRTLIMLTACIAVFAAQAAPKVESPVRGSGITRLTAVHTPKGHSMRFKITDGGKTILYSVAKRRRHYPSTNWTLLLPKTTPEQEAAEALLMLCRDNKENTKKNADN